MNKIIMGLLASSVLLSGCATHSEAPYATNFETQKQHKLQAASHWQLISQNVAQQLITALPERRPLHVRQSEQQSPFEKAFTQQLIASLTAAGYPVMKHADRSDTLIVDVSAVPLRFSKHRWQYKTTGGLTMLTSGLWVLERIYDVVSPGAAMVAGAAALDTTHWLRSEFASGPTPRTELIVTTSVSSADRYYVQNTSAYYTADDDWTLYDSWPSVAMPVRGGE